ncbi:hypothetical protein [Azospirillum sp.]|uniref:hypothetical protein n=1 Tax=Azospirillum sp. TaxID=34012 RepID=UPI002D2FD753|nr:hypothetical protein [Azospirillum sp.]HYD67600.1 hypothetical protein [Azospirillum sp.]
MAGITPFVTAVAPVVSTVSSAFPRGGSTTSDSSASAQQRYDYERQILELKAQQEQRQREEDARRAAEQQRLEWQRQDELRRQDWERQQQQRAWEQAQQTAQRSQELGWLARSQDQEAAQTLARQQAETATQDADAQGRLAALTAQAEAEERRRRDALRRAMARSRASLGGQGVSAADGSGEAILLGLVNETDTEGKKAARVDQLKRQAIQQEIDNRRRRNLLEQAQLAERQRLAFLSKYF